MNAFDATRAGSGDTGLASLFAATTTTPAKAQGAESAQQGATPFAQLLDQLNALLVPQASGVQIPRSLAAAEEEKPAGAAPPVSLAPAALPRRQLHPAAAGLAPIPVPAERAPVRGPAMDGGIRVPVIGKLLPPVAAGGTILPAEPVAAAVQGEGAGAAEEPPVADKPAGLGSEDTTRFIAPMAAQPIIPVPPVTPVPVAAVPMRSTSPGAVRADQRLAGDPATPAAVAPAGAAMPAAPAVTLTAADAPVAAAGDLRSTPEHASREIPFAAAPAPAPARPLGPVATDLHAAASAAEPMAAAPQLQPEPQQLAMQDLTQIVERLTAAREAAAPAATQLAVEHAEFGPLSLSIQQGDRGELAIAVAAADRDSQAALVAAMSQSEAAGFEQAPERRGSESAQRDPAAAGQNGDQRGQGAQSGQRDRFAGQQQQRQSMPQREPARERDGETRSGTYA